MEFPIPKLERSVAVPYSLVWGVKSGCHSLTQIPPQLSVPELKQSVAVPYIKVWGIEGGCVK